MLLRAADAENQKRIAALQERINGFSDVRSAMVRALGLDSTTAVPALAASRLAAAPGPPPHPAGLVTGRPQSQSDLVPGTPTKGPEPAEKEPTPLSKRLKKGEGQREKASREPSPAGSEPLEQPDDPPANRVVGTVEVAVEPAPDEDEEEDDEKIEGSDKVVLRIRATKDRGPWHELLLNDLENSPIRQLARRASVQAAKRQPKKIEATGSIRLRMATKNNPVEANNGDERDGRLPTTEMIKNTPEFVETLEYLHDAWDGGSVDGAVAIHIEDMCQGQLSSFVRQMNGALQGGWTEAQKFLTSMTDYMADKYPTTARVVGKYDIAESDEDGSEESNSTPASEPDPPPEKKRKSTVTFAKDAIKRQKRP